MEQKSLKEGVAIYTYKPQRKYPFKPTGGLGKNKALDSLYIKQHSLDLDISNTYDLLALQKALGNKGAMLMLEELGKVKPKGEKKGSKGQEIGRLSAIVPLDEQNEAMESNQSALQFKILSGENNLEAQEAVTSGRFAVKHNKRNTPQLKASEFLDGFQGFLNWISIMKVYLNPAEAKEIETEEGDQLLKPKDLKIRKEFELLLKMIDRLPELTDDEDVQRNYYRVYRFIIASGIDLGAFFQKNGNLKEQRALMIDALEDR